MTRIALAFGAGVHLVGENTGVNARGRGDHIGIPSPKPECGVTLASDAERTPKCVYFQRDAWTTEEDRYDAVSTTSIGTTPTPESRKRSMPGSSSGPSSGGG